MENTINLSSAFMSTFNEFMRLHNLLILIGQLIFWLDCTSGSKKVEHCHQAVFALLVRILLGMSYPYIWLLSSLLLYSHHYRQI